MPSDKAKWKRPDPRAAVQRDAGRLARRELGHRSFWQSLAVIGMVGWPIALGALGGTALGRWFDLRLQTGVHATLLLMMIGVAGGSVAAWKSVTRE